LPQNPSIGRYSDDIKVCIGFYLDSYSLVLTDDQFANKLTIATVEVGAEISATWQQRQVLAAGVLHTTYSNYIACDQIEKLAH
jgi:hypothetical protein